MVPFITEDDINEVAKVLRSGMLVQGKNVSAFEKQIELKLGVKHAVAVSNGTASLHLALCAFGIGPGDEVILPAYSYVATANVIELVGATPVFVDIKPATFNIDENKIEQAITSNTKAILPVHEFGLACNIKKVCSVAEQYNLKILEDAACALGAAEDGKPVGSFGTAASFSLHPRKSITSGEGGIITTNDDELAAKFKALRNHGIDPENPEMDFIMAGYNYRITDFQAALVSSQLNRFDTIVSHKQELAAVYMNELDSTLMRLPSIPKNKNHTWQTFHVVLNESINRNRLIAKLEDAGIGTNYGAQCIPATSFYYKKYCLNSSTIFPESFISYKQGLAIPLYFALKKEDIKYIAQTINKLIKNGN